MQRNFIRDSADYFCRLEFAQRPISAVTDRLATIETHLSSIGSDIDTIAYDAPQAEDHCSDIAHSLDHIADAIGEIGQAVADALERLDRIAVEYHHGIATPGSSPAPRNDSNTAPFGIF